MNLRGIVNGVTSTVNANTAAQLLRSIGYTTAPSAKRTPTYADPVAAQVQVQALSAKEVQHLDSLNIQGVLRKVYLYGDWRGVYRPDNQGGDLITFGANVRADLANTSWLIVQVLETWADWCSLAVQLQKS